MLRITIELIRHGNEATKQTLGVLHVSNDGTGTSTTANYNIAEMCDGGVVEYRVDGVDRHRNIFSFLKELFVKTGARQGFRASR